MISDFPPSTRNSRATTWQSAAGSSRAGGDWCDVFALADGALALTIGDVCGHGEAVSAAMAAIRGRVLESVAVKRVPSTTLAAINEFVCRFEAGLTVTAIVAIFDERARTLTFANAGHPPPLLVTAREYAFVGSLIGDLPLGVFEKHRAGDYVIALPPAALMVLYTDGLTEHARDPVAGERELVDAAHEVYRRPAVNAARAIARRVFKLGRGDDDAAAICLRTAAPA